MSRERGLHVSSGRGPWEPQGNLGARDHINRSVIQNGGGDRLKNGDLALGPRSKKDVKK